MIRTYTSIAAQVEHAVETGCIRDPERRHLYNPAENTRMHQWSDTGDTWFNGENAEETFQRARLGDRSLVPQAEALMAKFEKSIVTPRRVWEPSPAGSFVNVPDFLAGRPTSMRRQVQVQTESAPITICFDGTSSAIISAKDLLARGVAALALTMALVAVRPVTLYAMSSGSGDDSDCDTVLLSQINTTPLDLATACYALTSSGYYRRLCYRMMNRLNKFDGRWPQRASYRSGGNDAYSAELVQRLGLDPKHTLMIPAAHMKDELISQPVEWIQSNIDKFTQSEKEYAA